MAPMLFQFGNFTLDVETSLILLENITTLLSYMALWEDIHGGNLGQSAYLHCFSYLNSHNLGSQNVLHPNLDPSTIWVDPAEDSIF